LPRGKPHKDELDDPMELVNEASVDPELVEGAELSVRHHNLIGKEKGEREWERRGREREPPRLPQSGAKVVFVRGVVNVVTGPPAIASIRSTQ